MRTYQQEFLSALEFSEQTGFSADSQDLAANEALIPKLLQQLPVLMQEVLEYLSNAGFEPVREFGAQCANTHLALLDFIQSEYRDLRPNLTIGEFGINNDLPFRLTQDEFKHWLTSPPEIVDCHTWITLGSDVIIDCTGPTYLQTRVHLKNCLGGIAHGTPDNLVIAPIWTQIYQSYVTDMRGVRYLPVAVGAQALRAAAPKFGQRP